ncbi:MULTISPECIES: hypothetical protein [unclassified Nocardiopsis]|uniref:hypothetical protein n=1 Tax=unclassified Nocardiopsis TaxID=2649073 RepID=UPI001F16AF03|nr:MULTISPECIES: hypothetical protein [unclassified Nocardiopsis]
MNPRPLPHLLTAAALVLEEAGQLPPLIVAMTPGAGLRPPVTLSPATNLPAEEQHALVHAIARAHRWSAQPLSLADGWSTKGAVGGIRVEVMSAPGPSADGKVLRHPDASTAAHAALLRGLLDWAQALGDGVRELDVMEEAEGGAGLWALVRVKESVLESVLAEHAVMRVPAPHGWSGYRAEGVLPTGHRLMISI